MIEVPLAEGEYVISAEAVRKYFRGERLIILEVEDGVEGGDGT